MICRVPTPEWPQKSNINYLQWLVLFRMICIEAYRSAVGLWQNSSGKKQNQPLVKENRGGDSFGFVEPGPNEKKGVVN